MACHDADEFFPITVKAWGVDRGETPSRELSRRHHVHLGEAVPVPGSRRLHAGGRRRRVALLLDPQHLARPDQQHPHPRRTHRATGARAVLVRPPVGLHLRCLPLQGHARRHVQQGPQPGRAGTGSWRSSPATGRSPCSPRTPASASEYYEQTGSRAPRHDDRACGRHLHGRRPQPGADVGDAADHRLDQGRQLAQSRAVRGHRHLVPESLGVRVRRRRAARTSGA